MVEFGWLEGFLNTSFLPFSVYQLCQKKIPQAHRASSLLEVSKVKSHSASPPYANVIFRHRLEPHPTRRQYAKLLAMSENSHEVEPVAKSTIKKSENMKPADVAFYKAWDEMLGWMREYAKIARASCLKKRRTFPTIFIGWSALRFAHHHHEREPQRLEGNPVLLLNASPRHALFKEIVLHPFESHVYRKLKYSSDKSAVGREQARVYQRDAVYTSG